MVPETTENTQSNREQFKVKGEKLIARIKELVHEGNIRRIYIKNEKGETLIEVPLTFGVVGTLLAPVWAAIGAIAALAVDYTIVVEKIEEPGDETGQESDAEGREISIE